MIELDFACFIPIRWICCIPEALRDELSQPIRFPSLSAHKASREFSEDKWSRSTPRTASSLPEPSVDGAAPPPVRYTSMVPTRSSDCPSVTVTPYRSEEHTSELQSR